MYYLSWYVFYINNTCNIYIHVYTVIGFTEKQTCVCQFYMWFQEWCKVFVGLKLVPRVLFAFIDDNWHVVWLVSEKDFEIFHIHIRIQTLVKNDKFSLLYDCDL